MEGGNKSKVLSTEIAISNQTQGQTMAVQNKPRGPKMAHSDAQISLTICLHPSILHFLMHTSSYICYNSIQVFFISLSPT